MTAVHGNKYTLLNRTLLLPSKSMSYLAGTPSAFMGRNQVSTKLILSYVLDWIIITTASSVGVFFAHMTPNKRPFSLSNPEISFPFQNHEKVPTSMLGIYVIAIPAFVIYLICMVLVPGPTISKSTPKAAIWPRRLWEWHAGWLGLFFSLSCAFLITSGMKNLFGKPRPDLLSRCKPDTANISLYSLGDFFGTNLVSADICTETDMHKLNDGFRSYPSGHSSFAAGGLVYLSLFIASKLAITIPYLSPSSFTGHNNIRHIAFPDYAKPTACKKEAHSFNSNDHSVVEESSSHDENIISSRNEAAAPPIYLIVFAVVPFFASIYIASTRYSDFRHHGFDILFGYGIGFICAVFSFRMYHLPIRQGAGWAWGPRSSQRSFWAGVGVGNYAGYSNEWTDDSEAQPISKVELGEIENGVRRQEHTNDQMELLPMQSRFDPVEIDFLPSKDK